MFSCVFAGWTGGIVGALLCTSISGIQGTPLHPVSCRTLQFFAISAIDVDYIDMYPAGAVVNFQRSGGSIVPGKILGLSERSADYRTITYECSGTVVTHDCAPIAQMSVVRVPTTPRPTPAPSAPNRSERRPLAKTACHRGWSPLPSPLPSLLPMLPNLVPNLQPRVQPNLLPRWQPSLQPSLQLQNPFLWPLLSMCSSLESNTPARKSGIQSQFLSRAEHASQWTVPRSFVIHMPSCLHVLSCRVSFA